MARWLQHSEQLLRIQIFNFLTINESLDVVVLLLGLEGHEVHAALPAVVPGVEPAPLGVLGAEV